MDTSLFRPQKLKKTLYCLKDSILKDIEMDLNNRDNSIKKHDEKSLDKLQSRIVFTDPAYQFVFKKTEKIIAAIYLVTNLISDIEPIKFDIRKVGLSLMSDTVALKKIPSVQAKQNISTLILSVSEIISLLKIAHISNHVSAMNHAILQRELTLLLSSLESMHHENINSEGLVLAQDFFDVPLAAALIDRRQQSFVSNVPKGQYRTSINLKDNQSAEPQKDGIKDSRRESMLRLLKAGKPMGIKDFAKEIKGCSEKTLQRELLSMVESGVLKKTGERRWSLYSIA